MKAPYKSGIQFSNLPDHAVQEFMGRQPWSFYRLPEWNREKREPVKSAFPVSRELANIRREHGQGA